MLNTKLTFKVKRNCFKLSYSSDLKTFGYDNEGNTCTEKLTHFWEATSLTCLLVLSKISNVYRFPSTQLSALWLFTLNLASIPHNITQ